MPCNDNITPCQPCADCDCVETVPCDEINYTDTGCQETVSFRCLEYDGDVLSCINVLRNDTGDTILGKLNTKICQMDIPISITNVDHALSIVQSGYTNHTTIINVALSATSNNLLTKNSDGLYTTETPIVVTDSTSIHFTASGSFNHTITAVVKTSANSGNLITVQSDGIYMGLVGTGFVKSTGGTISYDNSTYLTGNQTITLSGDVTGSGATSIVTTIANGVITNPKLANSSLTITAGTGLSGGGTVSLGGSVTLNNTITQYTDALARAAHSLTTTGSSGASTYNSTTGVFNIPNYTASGLGAAPSSRILTINGTALDLSADRSWSVGTVTSVGATAGAGISISGSPVTTSGSITITSTITQYTDALARAAISLTTTGASGASTYNSTSGVLNVPTYTISGLGGVPIGRIITINGTAQDLSADRTWSVGTVTSVGATAGTGISVSGSPITSSGSITITNTAPDQTVALTSGTGISATGTYPNFTITNTAPDQTVSIASGSHISVTGSYPNFTVATTGFATVATSGAYSDLSGTPTPLTFNNGLTLSGSTVKLGGTLLAATTITNSGFKMLFSNGTDISIGGMFASGGEFTFSGTLTTTTDSQAGYAGTYGAVALTKTVTYSLDASSIYSAIWGATYVGQTGTMSSGLVSSLSSWSLFSNTGSVSSIAGLAIKQPKQQVGQTAFSGTCTNFYGILIEDISSSSIAAQLTNKFAIYQTGTSDISRFFGPVQNASSSVQFTSDVREKENIVDFTKGLAEVDQMNTKSFNYKYIKDRSTIGLIAQEVETYLPEAVSQGNFEVPGTDRKYEDFRMVDQTTLFYTMLNAIKELSAKVRVLEAK